jgi:ribonuclease VapC
VTEKDLVSVLDASALLALLHSEPGAEIVEEAIEGAAISTVNWAEVYQRWLARGVDVTDLRADLEALGMQIVPFIVEDAEQATELWSLTRQHGLSLGDRACLGLARRLGLPALTADRAWLDVNSGVEVRAIR